MVRAAAKNHAHVGVVVDPADYAAVLDELRRRRRAVRRTRRRLARTAFAHTAAYDAADRRPGSTTRRRRPAARRRSTWPLERVAGRCATARTPTRRAPATAPAAPTPLVGRRRAARRHGALLPQPLRRRRRLAARARPRRPSRPAVAIIKHANPCGVAVADDLADAYQRALECDERSAFGGIVALSTGRSTTPRSSAWSPGRRPTS